METVILTEIKELLTDIRDLLQVNSSPWLNTDRAMKYTGLGRYSLLYLIQEQNVRDHRPSPGRVLYHKEDLDKAIAKTKRHERGRPRTIRGLPPPLPAKPKIKEVV